MRDTRLQDKRSPELEHFLANRSLPASTAIDERKGSQNLLLVEKEAKYKACLANLEVPEEEDRPWVIQYRDTYYRTPEEITWVLKGLIRGELLPDANMKINPLYKDTVTKLAVYITDSEKTKRYLKWLFYCSGSILITGALVYLLTKLLS